MARSKSKKKRNKEKVLGLTFNYPKKVDLRHKVNIRKLLIGQVKIQLKKGSKPYLTHMLGTAFPDKLRREKRLHEKSTYECEFCHGKGSLTTKEIHEEIVKLGADLSFIASEAAVDVLTGIYGGDKNKYLRQLKPKAKGKWLSAATIVFNQETFFRRNAKIKSEINKYAKANEENLRKELSKQDEVAVVKDRVARLSKLTDKSVGYCPYCDGNGYYDIGHVDFEGKIIAIAMWLFNKNVKEGVTNILVGEIWDEFKNLKVQPQWAFAPGINAFGSTDGSILTRKVNRFNTVVNVINAGVARLINKFKAYYKHQRDIEEDPTALTYEAVVEFYKHIADFARTDTGTLKRVLTDDYKVLLERFEKIKHYAETSVNMVFNPYTKKVEHRFPLKKLIVQGPPSAARVGGISEKTHKAVRYPGNPSLFVYAAVYTGEEPFWTNPKKGEHETMLSIASKYFSRQQLPFLVLFPQEYMVE